MTTAYIICNNTNIEGVVLDDVDKAEDVKQYLIKQHQQIISPCKEYDKTFKWTIVAKQTSV